jgi:hypothetical protein
MAASGSERIAGCGGAIAFLKALLPIVCVYPPSAGSALAVFLPYDAA